MKYLCLLLALLICFSFCPSTKKVDNSLSNGFYVYVKDFTDRTNHKYLVESQDSLNSIFDYFFNSELELGDVDRPITIFNGKHDFYIARVNVFDKPNGKKGFKQLKYPNVYIKHQPLKKRKKLKPVNM